MRDIPDEYEPEPDEDTPEWTNAQPSDAPIFWAAIFGPQDRSDR